MSLKKLLPKLSPNRAKEILAVAHKTRVLVVGDVMLDQFIWGGVSRISPEAPVPVVDFSRESFMPGGAANVARNLVSLEMPAELFGVIGHDDAARKLQKLLGEQNIGCTGLVRNGKRHTSIKTRIVAHQQQVVRIDRETRGALDPKTTAKLLAGFKAGLAGADAVIVGDYGKGVVTQLLLNELKSLCRERGIWLSLDPKPVHHLNLNGISLITPNRKEAFELADLPDRTLLIGRDGGEWPIDGDAAPILDAAGHPAGVVLVFRDVTEQRKADIARARLAYWRSPAFPMARAEPTRPCRWPDRSRPASPAM